MEIGLSLPTMAPGFSEATLRDWCAAADDGPLSSISCGERVTFHNPEAMVTMAAAAALTRRLRVFLNLVVLPAHPVAEVAKQVATLDVLSGGRVTLGVGVGGRGHDYRSLEAPYGRRHARLDEQVAELRRLWAGAPPFEGADPVGPAPCQPGGPPILAGAMGPKALARAARWADGVVGFSVACVGEEVLRANGAARRAWHDAGRDRPPRLVSGGFYVLGVEEPATTLRRFTHDYLAIFGEDFAAPIADAMRTSTPDAVHQILDEAEEAGCDEFILVPGSTDVACLEATLDLVASL